MGFSVDTVRGLTRPVVTIGLGAAFIYAAIEVGPDEAAIIGTPFGITVGFWFQDRAAGKVDPE